ncbi:MAG: RHS repeat domain-containing protein [Bacteroidota bacterium]
MSEAIQKTAVKKMRRYSGSLKNLKEDGMSNDKEMLSIEIIYRADGKAEGELRYNTSGQLEEKHEYIYDDAGRLILHNWNMPIDEVEQSERTERDEKGRVLREVKLYYGEEGDSINYLYDDKDRVIEIKSLDEEGAEVHNEKLEYNEKGHIISRKVVDHHGGLSSGVSYIYDEKENLVGQSEMNDKGELLFRTVIEQDANGNDISIIQYNPKNEITQRVMNTYDENNRVIKRLASGMYARIYTFEYDDAGLLATESATDENGTLISRSSYHYDEEGRMIHETSYEMDLTHSGRDMAMTYRYEYEM